MLNRRHPAPRPNQWPLPARIIGATSRGVATVAARRQHLRGVWPLAAACLATLVVACGGTRNPCRDLLRARAHSAVIVLCPDTDEGALARAFKDAGRDDLAADAAARTAQSLVGTEYTAEAAYLVGYIDGSSRDRIRERRAQVYLAVAVALYRLAHRYDEAAIAGRRLAFLKGVAGLPVALAAVDDARTSGEPGVIVDALTGLAEVYGEIGMADDARDAFVRAENAGASPETLAFTYLKHGYLLIGLESVADRRAGIAYLREAKRLGSEGTTYAARLNLAAAYIDLDEIDRGLAELDGLEGPRVTLVTAYGLARRGQLGTAEKLLVDAELDADDAEYFITFAMEAARGALARGDSDTAIDYYRRAIAAVEEVRRLAPHPELRPWVLTRAAAPYQALVDLLARRGTASAALEALQVTEALHARTLLDAAVGRAAGPDRELIIAQARERLPPQEPLSIDELLARLASREALVFVAGWRFHLLNGRVEVAAISNGDLDAARAFLADFGDADAAAIAAAALLPAGIGTRTETLYVVPGAGLADVPFAALPIDGKSLVERRAVALLPGLAALGCRPGPSPWTTARVYLGDAAGDLPAAAGEVRRLGGNSARVGAAADRASVRAAQDAALLHVAVHGHVSRAGGALELADGPLTAAEIVAEGIAPRVAVLTGCGTGASAGLDAEDWGSFPSAFLAAGSAFVIATLRSVPDAEAAVVVDAYYAAAPDLDPVARLAAAQRQLITESRRAIAAGQPAPVPPNVWASFAAWGDAACGP